MNATLTDLKLELWWRRRNADSLIWKTKNGEQISLRDMTDAHLENAITCLESHYEDEDIIDCITEIEDAGDRS